MEYNKFIIDDLNLIKELIRSITDKVNVIANQVLNIEDKLDSQNAMIIKLELDINKIIEFNLINETNKECLEKTTDNISTQMTECQLKIETVKNKQSVIIDSVEKYKNNIGLELNKYIDKIDKFHNNQLQTLDKISEKIIDMDDHIQNFQIKYDVLKQTQLYNHELKCEIESYIISNEEISKKINNMHDIIESYSNKKKPNTQISYADVLRNSDSKFSDDINTQPISIKSDSANNTIHTPINYSPHMINYLTPPPIINVPPSHIINFPPPNIIDKSTMSDIKLHYPPYINKLPRLNISNIKNNYI